jgi:hypothetical protein
MLVFGFTKFIEGAWIIVLLTPVLVTVFFTIHHHYKKLAGSLSLEHGMRNQRIQRNRVVVLMAGVHQGSLAALQYARRLSDDVTVVHVSTDPAESQKIRQKWDVYGDNFRLVLLDSPYRLMIEPLLEYLAYLEENKAPNEIITIVVPNFIPKEWWARFLHMRTAETLRNVLRNRELKYMGEYLLVSIIHFFPYGTLSHDVALSAKRDAGAGGVGYQHPCALRD